MRKSIRFRLIGIITLLIIVLFSFYSYFIYKYDVSIVNQQLKKDGQNVIDRTAQSIAYIQKDIEQFASAIIIDPELSAALRFQPLNTKEKILKNYRICRRLNTYKLQKLYIFNIYIEDIDKNLFSASLSEISSLSRETDFSTLHFTGNKNSCYSDRYEASVTNINRDVIAYRTKIIDLWDNMQERGYLYICIDFDAFQKILNDSSQVFDHLVLTDKKETNILYGTLESISNVNDEFALYSREDALSGNWILSAAISQQNIKSNTKKLLYIFIISTLLCVILAGIILALVISYALSPLKDIKQAMKQVSSGDLTVQIPIKREDELGKLSESFNEMINELDRSVKEHIEDEKKQDRLKNDLLISQITPHFLCNTLDSSIFLMSQNRIPEAIVLTKSLVILLQDNLKIASDGFFSTVQEEIKSLTSYLSLQSIRYQERFTYQFQIDEKTYNYLIPRLILQPIVENALFHGILPLPRQGQITVRIFEERKTLHIIISDDGKGMSEDEREKVLSGVTLVKGSRMRPVGLKNVQERLQILYHESYSFNIISAQNCGTTVYIKLGIGKEQKLS